MIYFYPVVLTAHISRIEQDGFWALIAHGTPRLNAVHHDPLEVHHHCGRLQRVDAALCLALHPMV